MMGVGSFLESEGMGHSLGTLGRVVEVDGGNVEEEWREKRGGLRTGQEIMLSFEVRELGPKGKGMGCSAYPD